MINLEQQLAHLPKPSIVMGVGIPGSGKSTALEEIADHLGMELICPDAIRKELTGDASDQSKNPEAWAEAYMMAEASLKLGHSAIIDATHTEAWRRPDQVAKYRAYGATAVVAAVFDTPLEICKQRNEKRDRVVPGPVLDRMYKALQSKPVIKDEGFDAIFVVRPE